MGRWVFALVAVVGVVVGWEAAIQSAALAPAWARASAGWLAGLPFVAASPRAAETAQASTGDQALALWTAALAVGTLLLVVVTWLSSRAEAKTSRLSHSVSAMFELEVRFGCEETQQKRRAAAEYLGNNSAWKEPHKRCPKDQRCPHAEPPREFQDVMNFFDMVGLLLRRNAIDTEFARSMFGWWAVRYHFAAREFMQLGRRHDKRLWIHFTYFANKVRRRRGLLTRLRHPHQPEFSDAEMRGFFGIEMTRADAVAAPTAVVASRNGHSPHLKRALHKLVDAWLPDGRASEETQPIRR
jgi:hypothetical protein